MIIAVLSWASGSRATDCTIFVRTGSMSSEPDGLTPLTAFPTITQGARAVRNPGDVLCVGPGTYSEGNIGLSVDGAPGEATSNNPSPIEIYADTTGDLTGGPAGPVQIVPPPPDSPDADTVTTAFLLMGRHDVIIDGFTISGFKDPGIQVRTSVDGANSKNVTIRNNTITKCRGGIDVLGEGTMVIEGNSVVDNRGSGITVERCLLTTENGRCRIGQFLPVVPVISNNRTGGNDAHGIFLQATDNAVVQNNFIYANGAPPPVTAIGAGIVLRECNDTLVANNLVYANRGQGVAVGNGNAAYPSPGTVILNNTIYGNGDWGIQIGDQLAGSPRGAVVNNIIWRNHDVDGDPATRRGIGVLNENSGSTPIRPASTCGYIAGFNFVLDAYGSDTPYNAYDRYDPSGDPLFVNPAGDDGILGGERGDGGFIDRSADDEFQLQQLPGQDRSRAVDAGSVPIDAIHLSGSTATDGRPDTGVIDIGFHYGADAEQVLAFAAPYMPLYVRRIGHDTNSGLTPSAALATVQVAAGQAQAGITVVVGPGRYSECQLFIPKNHGKVTFIADATGARTGEAAGLTLIDAQQCVYNPDTSLYGPGETGFDISSSCDVVIDGFHVTGASEDGIRVDDNSDGAVIRDNVVYGIGKPPQSGGRAIHVIDSNDVQIINNLAFDNTAGIVLGGNSKTSNPGSRNAVIEFNTVYNSVFNGIQIGDVGVSSDATLKYNVTARNKKAGIEVGSDETRDVNLAGFRNAYNFIADSYASGVDRGPGDIVGWDVLNDPIYLDPDIDPIQIDVNVDWRFDQHFRLVQSSSNRAVDHADVTAPKAGVAELTTSMNDAADSGPADLGYHYPRRGVLAGDCNGDGRVRINELVMSVNIALEQVPMASCTAIDLNADGHATVNELITAVGSALE